MTLYGHFDELRVRLMRALWVFMGGFVLCYCFAEPILAVLRKPLFDVLPPGQQRLYYTSLFENFLTHLKVAGYAAAFLISPYFFHEIWGFISPGLYPRERKYVFPFMAAVTAFFLAGASFAYFVLFPVGFKYFISYGAPSDAPMLTISSYYGTVLKLLMLFGLAFELPVLVCFLGFLGIVDAPFLRQHRRSAIIGITVLAAFVAPPDAISMLLLGGPLVLLYEGSIWVVQWFGARRRADAKAAEELNPLMGRSEHP